MQVMHRLYTTGVFFFAVAYIGRDLLPVAQLLHATHAEQVFQGVQDPALRASLPVGERSILGNLLPESLLYQLEAYGPKAFAEQMTRYGPLSAPRSPLPPGRPPLRTPPTDARGASVTHLAAAAAAASATPCDLDRSVDALQLQRRCGCAPQAAPRSSRARRERACREHACRERACRERACRERACRPAGVAPCAVGNRGRGCPADASACGTVHAANHPRTGLAVVTPDDPASVQAGGRPRGAVVAGDAGGGAAASGARAPRRAAAAAA